MDRDPELYFADDGAPRSGRFGDIYYSLQDGLDEARAVFLGGCHLPSGWAGFSDFTVLELGFGTGLNIAALIEMWAAHRPASAHLHVFSIEGYLMSADQTAQALAHWPGLAPFAQALVAQWPKARRGFHTLDFPQWGVSVTVATMDVMEALRAWQGRADAVFLDGFSPALNPDMWRQEVLDAVAARVRPGARLGTFTVAGAVRRGLTQAGFTVRKCAGFGRKRERLEAMLTPPGGCGVSARPRRIAVIGAGIAGCALVHQARHLGLSADLFDAEGPGAGASGNDAALVTPRLDAGDNAISALFADSFAYASALYRRLCPQAILTEGMVQLAAGPRDESRFRRIAAQTCFAADDLSFLPAGEVPEAPTMSAIRLHTALCVRPADVLAALLGDVRVTPARILSIKAGTLVDAEGAEHGLYDAVILAAGDGLFDLDDLAAQLDLRAVRGQVERAVTQDRPERALGWGGYAIPLADGFVFGATHERDDRGTEPRQADRTRNLDSLAVVMPERAQAMTESALRSRASVRVTTRDYLPVAGEVAPGVYILSGMGARGFCLAPLLAKALLCDILGAPLPLPESANMLLRPERLIAARASCKEQS